MNHIKKTNIFILLVFILQPLANLLLGFLFYRYNIDLSFSQGLLITQGLLIFLPFLLFFAFSGKDNPCKKITFRKLSFVQILLLIIIPFCSIPITALIRSISSIFVSAPIADALDTASVSYNYFLMLIFVAVIPAINEELFVRGILFSNYKNINLRTGIVLSSMLFGMLHFNFDQFFYATVLGIILALAYEFTENLIAPMIIHFVINGTSVSLMYLSKALNKFSESLVGESSGELVNASQTVSPEIPFILYFIIIGVLAALSVLSILILYYIMRYFAKLTNKLDVFYSLFKGKPQISFRSLLTHWPITLCTIIFIAYSILLELI